MRRRGPPATGAEGVAAVAATCAALMRGGIAAERALPIAAEETRDPGALDVAARVAAGASIAEAIAAQGQPEWRVLAAAWELAERSGAPLSHALAGIAAALRELTRLRQQRTVLLSGPRATVRMVAALPPLALVLGGLLGFDPLPVLLSPVGAALLCAGAVLLGAGVGWARSLARSVEGDDRIAGLEFELAWIALRGGTAPAEALVRVADCVDEFGAEWIGFDCFRAGAPLRTALATALRVGVPVGPLLLEEAQAVRAGARAELESEAERLGVRVLVPLGVCVLPAFIALGVLPVLLSMLGGL